MFNLSSIGNITIYQIILALVSSFIVGKRLIRFIRHETSQSFAKMFVVVGIWGSIGAVALYPEIAHFIREKMGFGENFNTLIFIAFVILFSLFFRILSIIERIESQITEIIRKEALKDINKVASSSSNKFIK